MGIPIIYPLYYNSSQHTLPCTAMTVSSLWPGFTESIGIRHRIGSQLPSVAFIRKGKAQWNATGSDLTLLCPALIEMYMKAKY